MLNLKADHAFIAHGPPFSQGYIQLYYVVEHFLAAGLTIFAGQSKIGNPIWAMQQQLLPSMFTVMFRTQ